MSGQLPALTSRQVVKALRKVGYEEIRQKGSHLILFNYATKSRVTIPVHKGKDIKKPLLRKILESEAHISISEFLKLL